MSFTFTIGQPKFVPYPIAFKEFRQGQEQPIGRYIYKCGLELQALAKGDAPKDTGLMASRIVVNYHRGVANPRVNIVSPQKYSYFVHEGTRPHVISARKGRVLQFMYRGRIVYATKVNHPGTRPDRFLSRHLRTVIN